MTYTRRKRSMRATRDPLEHFIDAGAWPVRVENHVRFAEEMADEASGIAAIYRQALREGFWRAGGWAPNRGPEAWHLYADDHQAEAEQWAELAAAAAEHPPRILPFVVDRSGFRSKHNR